MIKKDIYNLFDILRSKGRYGDTELAHVTPEEKRILEARGGAGTINPLTGLREYHKEELDPNLPPDYNYQGNYWYHHTNADGDHVSSDMQKYYERQQELAWEEEQETSKERGDVADVIKYSDYSEFIDPVTGGITDQMGFANYLLGLDVIQAKGYRPWKWDDKQALIDQFSDLGQLQVDAKNIRDKEYEYQTALTDVHGQLLGERKKTSQAIGQSGFYDPTAKGFGGTPLAQTSSIYGDLGVMPSQKQNVYGLGTGSEEALLSWIDEDIANI